MHYLHFATSPVLLSKTTAYRRVIHFAGCKRGSRIAAHTIPLRHSFIFFILPVKQEALI